MDVLDFLEIPWQTLSKERAILLQKELNSELVETHILFGKTTTAFVHRIDNDDVIFWIEEFKKYAVVHLTWSKTNSLGFPKTDVFSLDDLKSHCKRISEFY